MASLVQLNEACLYVSDGRTPIDDLEPEDHRSISRVVADLNLDLFNGIIEFIHDGGVITPGDQEVSPKSAAIIAAIACESAHISKESASGSARALGIDGRFFAGKVAEFRKHWISQLAEMESMAAAGSDVYELIWDGRDFYEKMFHTILKSSDARLAAISIGFPIGARILGNRNMTWWAGRLGYTRSCISVIAKKFGRFAKLPSSTYQKSNESSEVYRNARLNFIDSLAIIS